MKKETRYVFVRTVSLAISLQQTQLLDDLVDVINVFGGDTLPKELVQDLLSLHQTNSAIDSWKALQELPSTVPELAKILLMPLFDLLDNNRRTTSGLFIKCQFISFSLSLSLSLSLSFSLSQQMLGSAIEQSQTVTHRMVSLLLQWCSLLLDRLMLMENGALLRNSVRLCIIASSLDPTLASSTAVVSERLLESIFHVTHHQRTPLPSLTLDFFQSLLVDVGKSETNADRFVQFAQIALAPTLQPQQQQQQRDTTTAITKFVTMLRSLPQTATTKQVIRYHETGGK
jgi:hypothetical protein